MRHGGQEAERPAPHWGVYEDVRSAVGAGRVTALFQPQKLPGAAALLLAWSP